MDLNAEQRARFADEGILHLPRAIPTNRTSAARDGILTELGRLGARTGSKWHVAKMPSQIKHQPSFDAVIPADVVRGLDELAGCALIAGQPQILLTPPGSSKWSVPHLGWHLDVKAPSRDELPGIQVFVLLDDLAPQGGGTVAIAGSHRLHAARGGRGNSAHHVLKSHAAWSALFTPEATDRARFMKPVPVGDVPVRIVEMCGRAGDVYLMDMRILHAPAPNATKNVRMMLTNRYLRAR